MLIAILSSLILGLASGQRPQPLVETYRQSRGDLDKTTYYHQVKAALENNRYIPDWKSGIFRVVTYNIHYYRDILDKFNLEHMINDIKRTNPTVVILQEVPWEDRDLIKRHLLGAGFKYTITEINVTKGNAAFCGNLIASRDSAKIKHLKTLRFDDERNAVVVQVEYNGHKIAVVGTHADDNHRYPNNRKKQAKKVLKYIKHDLVRHYDYIVLAGDFNESYENAGVNLLGTSAFVEEVFRGLRWPAPQMTCWAGTAIDHIFASPELMKLAKGAYLFHSVNSDHMPVIADFKLTRSRRKADGPKNLHRRE
jgi:endonuclease/exonuclease/phosphatase family metal-dependent hydrolase